MNKVNLIKALRAETGLSITKAKEIVQIFFHEISNALAMGDRVVIRGLFSIFVKEYKGYTGRNPRTGEPIDVKPRKLPFFKCGKELKERVNYKYTQRITEQIETIDQGTKPPYRQRGQVPDLHLGQ